MKVARILLDGFMLEDEAGGRGDGGYFATGGEALKLLQYYGGNFSYNTIAIYCSLTLLPTISKLVML